MIIVSNINKSALYFHDTAVSAQCLVIIEGFSFIKIFDIRICADVLLKDLYQFGKNFFCLRKAAILLIVIACVKHPVDQLVVSDYLLIILLIV